MIYLARFAYLLRGLKQSTLAAYMLKKYLADIRQILETPATKKYAELQVEEYPFDAQLLTLSQLYRTSRALYVGLGGTFRARVCSTMRSLSATDLFKDEIDYTPGETEVLWLEKHHAEVFDAETLADSLTAFNGISLYHEQNHRIVWRLLPKVPKDAADVVRYLNMSEALIVTLDLALGDDIGAKLSAPFERMKSIYHPGGSDKWASGRGQNDDYSQYLRTLFYVTYLVLALVDRRDISKCLDYVFPNQLQMNRVASKRALALSDLFTQNTNREWQRRYWKQAQAALTKLQKSKPVFYVVHDPLDFENEFEIADTVFEAFGL